MLNLTDLADRQKKNCQRHFYVLSKYKLFKNLIIKKIPNDADFNGETCVLKKGGLLKMMKRNVIKL